MNVTEYAVHRLTEPHTIQVEGHTTEWVPLLCWLETRVTELVGRKGGAGASAGLPLNADAMILLDYVDERLKLMRETHNLPSSGDRRKDVVSVWDHAKTERAGGRLDDEAWDAVCGEFQEWVARIEAEDNRPRKKELTVPCPRCEKRWVVNDGERVSAVVIVYWHGSAPIAKCQNEECSAIWVGLADVARLGFTVGAASDYALLEACGIDTPKIGVTSL